MMGLYGAVPAKAEQFRVFADGAAVRTAPFAKVADANAVGVAYVPADRRKEGLLLPHSIDFNLLLPFFARHSAERRRTARGDGNHRTSGAAPQYPRRSSDGRPRPCPAATSRRSLVSKWLPLEPSVLLLNDPTRGVDVETKREIYVALRAMAAEGKAVVLLSTDTPELVHLCDRVMVFHKGRVAATLAARRGVRGSDRRGRHGRATSADPSGRERSDAGSGRATLLGDPVAAQRRPWRAVSGPRRCSRRSTRFLFPGIFAVGAMAKFVQGWFPTAMVAAAETIVMLTGGIDLSVGPMVSLGSVVAASTMQGPLGVFGGVLALLAAGDGVGAIVGGFVAIGRYPAIIVTLALSFVLRGVALLIMPRPGGYVPPSLVRFSRRQSSDRGRSAGAARHLLEALSGDAFRHRPDRCRRQCRGRLPLRSQRHRARA